MIEEKHFVGVGEMYVIKEKMTSWLFNAPLSDLNVTFQSRASYIYIHTLHEVREQ